MTTATSQIAAETKWHNHKQNLPPESLGFASQIVWRMSDTISINTRQYKLTQVR